MTQPKDLQHRVAVAFNAKSAALPDTQADQGFGDDDFMPPIEPDPDAVAPGEAELDRHSMLRYWLAGGGLIASALVLASGTSSGFIVLAICLAAIGLVSILFSVAERLENRIERWSGTAAPAARPAELVVPNRADASYSGAGDLLASIHDALGDMTVSRNLNGTILSANNTFMEITGCEHPEGRTCEELGLKFEPGLIAHSYDVSIIEGGRTRVFLWHDVVAPDPMLGDLVVQSIARDVTDERADAQSREAAQRHAEEESGLKSRLIATVSHEIRTPLSGLLGMGHLLAGTDLTPEQRNYLEGIRQSGTALAQLVEDLLDFSTLAAGRFELRPRQEAIRPLVENLVEMLSSRAHAKGIELATVFDPAIPEQLEFDPTRFRQVLYNVIGNAVKFTEKGGVLVSAELTGGILEVRVTDTGPGMDSGEMQRIFGEFEQGDLSRAREGGVGLGLAISARIMAEAQGSLTVQSAIGSGSTFTIRLPVKSIGQALRSGRDLAGMDILVVAPEGPAATGLVRSLIGFGAVVRSASTEGELDALLVPRAPAAIIVDHRLEALFNEAVRQDPKVAGANKIYLVNPESRPAKMSGSHYDSWLIRPLREQSLIDVLTGKLRGLEARAAANDDFPVLAPEAVVLDAGSEVEPTEDNQGYSVLIGEDDPVNAMIAQAILEKAGHRVRLANSFAQLDAMLAEAPADIVLTDNAMGDGTSDAFIARLRVRESANGLDALPVIVLTADSREETRRKLLVHGADLVLIKPANPDILCGAVERLSRRQVHAA